MNSGTTTPKPAAPTDGGLGIMPGPFSQPGLGGFGSAVADALKNPDNANIGSNVTLPSNFASAYNIPITPTGQVDYSQLPTQTSAKPAFNFDTDPGVLAAVANEQQDVSQLDANLRAARERAIIQFGDPALAGMAGFGIDPQAADFARQNYLSGNASLARLNRAHDLARQAIINRLAAHGILQSGDLGYLEGQENQAYGNQVYDAQQQVLDQLANLFSNYLGQRQNLDQAVLNARQAAIQNFLGNPDAYAAMFGGGSMQSSANAPTAPPLPKVTAPKPTRTRYAAGISGPAIGAFK